ncbi:T9SS type A sorting domain-containing protein [Bacteroidales bacterium OttesenSCG-928-K22]|nr:T9SS type A sorting domain-containing protein [Bacteroidales bacterium OttesenSCG-928-L14]MDL2240232.1 T9SS type A sorting domain-containing protein [Bacteroidales bacterium OttesenSCG-928-K22]
MKTKITLFFIILFYTITVFAQKDTTFEKNNYKLSITSECDYKEVDSVSSNSFMLISDYPNTIPKEVDDLIEVTFSFVGQWISFSLTNTDSDYYNIFNTGNNEISLSLEPKNYGILVIGKRLNKDAIIAISNIELLESQTIELDMLNSPKNLITFNPLDHNHIPLIEHEDIQIFSILVDFSLYSSWVSNNSSTLLWFTNNNFIPQFYCNDFTTESRLWAFAQVADGNNNFYTVSFPTINQGLSSDYVFVNNPEEYAHFSTSFYLDEQAMVYPTASFNYVKFGNGDCAKAAGEVSLPDYYFTNNDTINIYVDSKLSANTGVGDGILLSFPKVNKTIINGLKEDIILPCMFSGDDNSVLFNPFYTFAKDAYTLSFNRVSLLFNNSLFEEMPNNTYLNIINRAPILYHIPYKIQGARLIDKFYYKGDYNEERNIDKEKTTIKITHEDVLVFDDLLCNFSQTGINLPNGPIKITLNNNTNNAFGLNIKNTTDIKYNYLNEDWEPPTLSMLKLTDNNLIKMNFTDLTNAEIIFTAGDFETYAGSPLNSSYRNYTGKPEVEVFYNYDNETLQPLTFSEDESKFHEGYGNCFVIKLDQLIGKIPYNKWINLHVKLMDDEGNSQQQTLEPLFFYGDDIIGINNFNFNESNVYPNPFVDMFTIEFSETISENIVLQIYDTSGKLISTKNYVCSNETSITFNGQNIKKGVYVYFVYTKKQIYKGKIIKE